MRGLCKRDQNDTFLGIITNHQNGMTRAASKADHNHHIPHHHTPPPPHTPSQHPTTQRPCPDPHNTNRRAQCIDEGPLGLGREALE